MTGIPSSLKRFVRHSAPWGVKKLGSRRVRMEATRDFAKAVPRRKTLARGPRLRFEASSTYKRPPVKVGPTLGSVVAPRGSWDRDRLGGILERPIRPEDRGWKAPAAAAAGAIAAHFMLEGRRKRRAKAKAQLVAKKKRKAVKGKRK
jgi:hypothetical protein